MKRKQQVYIYAAQNTGSWGMDTCTPITSSIANEKNPTSTHINFLFMFLYAQCLIDVTYLSFLADTLKERRHA